MTKINTLVLHGFKSFAKRTELVFGDQFNCVLGPNGSGKSNIIDALCFVLGKSSAKALRSEKSANLIYNGGKTKQPAKFGEVSIFFDNSDKEFPTDDKEVKVTRIVRQNGNSVYKINDEARTRQQVLEMLSLARIEPEGHNIILQGDIVHFTEMPPEERRLILEEISGVSVYEDKKQKALHDLEKVGERLKECDIILKERHSRLNELKNERDQAVKHKDLHDKIKKNKASLLYQQVSRKTDEQNDFQDKIKKSKEQQDEKQGDINSIKKKIQDSRDEISEINKEIETKGEKDQVAIHKEVEKLKVDIASSINRQESLAVEMKKVEERKQQLILNKKEVEEKIKEIEQQSKQFQNDIHSRQKEQDMLQRRIEEFRKKHSLDNAGDLEKSIDKLDKDAEELQKKIQDLRAQQQDALREKDKLEFQIKTIEDRVLKVLEVEKENKAQIDELKQKKAEFKKLTVELSQMLNNDASLAAQLTNARQSLLQATEDLSRLRAKNISIQESLGADLAVREILNQKKDISGIYGTVAELGEVSSKYSLALEIAAGTKLKSIVVKDDAVAAQCIKYLKDRKLGIATFLPLNKVKPVAPNNDVLALKKTEGVHGLATDLVSYDPKLKNIFSYVFGNTLVVDNINVARRIGVGKAKMVTIEGDLTELSGAMQGGYRQKRAGVGFQDKELAKDIASHEIKLTDTQHIISRLEKEKRESEDAIARYRELKASLEGDIIKIEKSLHLDHGDLEASKKEQKELQQQLGKIEKTIQDVQQKISDVNRDLATNKIERQKLRQQITDLRNPILLAELNAFEEKRQDLRSKIVEKETEVKNFDAQAQNIHQPEIEKITKIIKQHEKEQDDFKKELVSLSKRMDDMKKDLKQKEEQQQKFHEQFKGLFTKRSKIEENIQSYDKRLEEAYDVHRKVELRTNALSLELAKVTAEFNAFQEEYKQYEGVEVFKTKSEADLRKEIGIYEGVLTRMGSVNMKALEIYDTAEHEYQELVKKKEKLGLEKEDILLLMNEIETKKKDLFMTAFEIVNKNFQTIFGALTTKGEASIVLENPERPFDAGALIKVKLTSNKFMDIRSLSGGEKTLTALAFIFAIQEHEPASFYIMDEVDAALDKRNSDRLAKLVRKYTERAQYVVISHNDGIISEADRLYGIAMDEHGISSVTSLKV
ncbi:chromosome segregation protein SMC [Candidatus Woesearchaeota archaeon]|nr:chromosome segregation protein SMC [Candidatus Woesearchaeota archaeon]